MSNNVIFVNDDKLASVMDSLETLKRHIERTNESSAITFYRSVEPLLYSSVRYKIFLKEYQNRLTEATKRCTPNESGDLVNEYDCSPETEALEAIADSIWGIDYAYGHHSDMYNDILYALFEEVSLNPELNNKLRR